MNVVDEIGSATLKKINAFTMSYELFSYLVDRYDCQNNWLNIHNIIVPIHETDMGCILGWKKGGIDVGKYFTKSLTIDEDLESQLNIFIANKMIIPFHLKNNVKRSENLIMNL